MNSNSDLNTVYFDIQIPSTQVDGTPLDDFIQFQIKIIMQGTNAVKPPRIKDLRVIEFPRGNN